MDLNLPTDFAKVTTSGVAGILSQFTGKGESAWKISEGSYTGGGPEGSLVVFHVFESAVPHKGALSKITDNTGRRKVKFRFPFKDGQTTSDLGRKPNTYTLDIILFGDSYLSAFKDLLTELNDPVPGILNHPVLGKINCGMEELEVTHQSEERKAVTLRLTLIEHNFSVAQINPQDPTVRGALSKLSDAFAKIDRAIAAVEGTIIAVRSLKNQIKNTLNDYKTLFARTSSNMNSVFNPGGTGDFPSLLPVQQGGSQDAQGNIVSEISTAAASPTDPFSSVPINITTQTDSAIAAEQIAKEVQSSRDTLSSAILQMQGAGDGQGALEFFDNVIELYETAIDLQAAYEKGKQSSQVRVIQYTTPRLMSIREVAFSVGIPVSRVNEIDILNPFLECTNFIPQGTLLRVAV